MELGNGAIAFDCSVVFLGGGRAYRDGLKGLAGDLEESVGFL